MSEGRLQEPECESLECETCRKETIDALVEKLKEVNRAYSLSAKEKRCGCCPDYDHNRKIDQSDLADDLFDILGWPEDDRGYVK